MASVDPKNDLDPKNSFLFSFDNAVIERLVKGLEGRYFHGIRQLLGVEISQHDQQGRNWVYRITAQDRNVAELAHGFLKELTHTALTLYLADVQMTDEDKKTLSKGKNHIQSSHWLRMENTFGSLQKIYGRRIGEDKRMERLIDRSIKAYFEAAGIPNTIERPQTPKVPNPGVSSQMSATSTQTHAAPRRKGGLKNLADFEPRNDSQGLMYLAIKDPDIDIVFGTGPAGGGKTFGALQAAFEAIGNDDIDRIILFRPKRTTSGEETAAVPGDSDKKAWPYVKSFDSACRAVTGTSLSALHKKAEGKIIFGIPEAERGETYHRSLVIIDEAQNLTITEAKMLITRIGEGSKLVFLGDIGQTDLKHEESGLVFLINHLGARYYDDAVLRAGVAFVEFTADDSSARHRLLPALLSALDATPPGVTPAAVLSPKKARAAFQVALDKNRTLALDMLGKLHMATEHRFGQALRDLRQAYPQPSSNVVRFDDHRPTGD